MTPQRGTSDDPIAAANRHQRLTGGGPAGIAVIGMGGPDAATFLERHVRFTGRAGAKPLECGDVRRADLLDAAGEPIDDIVITRHAPDDGPYEFLLHLHGSAWLVEHCESLLDSARFAAMPPFHPALQSIDAIERAQCELLPRIATADGTRWLLRQARRIRSLIRRGSEGDVAALETLVQAANRLPRVEWFITPLQIVLAGPPNAGKSTLMNALTDQSTSIVSPEPGTTRDWIEAASEMLGRPVLLRDTAGIRATGESLESASIDRAHGQIRSADALVVVLDASPAGLAGAIAFADSQAALNPAVIACNKLDAADSAVPPGLTDALPAHWLSRLIPISALNRRNLDALHRPILEATGRWGDDLDAPTAFSEVIAAACRAGYRSQLRAMLA